MHTMNKTQLFVKLQCDRLNLKNSIKDTNVSKPNIDGEIRNLEPRNTLFFNEHPSH